MLVLPASCTPRLSAVHAVENLRTLWGATPWQPDTGTNSERAILRQVLWGTSALNNIKSAITQLASDRATIGANLARFNATTEQLGVLSDNLTAANSRIKDVDVAEESTAYARYNILVQAGTAMLAQANTSQQTVLKLLQG